MSINTDQEAMTSGVKQLLGYMPYACVDSTPKCDHISDGFVYNDSQDGIHESTLKCDICGEFYQQTI